MAIVVLTDGARGLAFERRLLIRVVGRAGLDRRARGGGGRRLILSIGPAGGENQGGGGSGEEGGAQHGGS
ncbi:hypothetical protein [Brevundimonas vancanneytii]|uniref:hypothetical protein n=1 Tax=Brevundimonas vancanneytii TaxID=1325724 RepID=UPI0033B2BD83